jgi:hypothetical protein
MNRLRFAGMIVCAVGAGLLAPSVSQAEEAEGGPTPGLVLEARLFQQVGASGSSVFSLAASQPGSGNGGGSSLGIFALLGHDQVGFNPGFGPLGLGAGLAPFAAGYRGERWAVLAGPSLTRYSFDSYGSTCSVQPCTPTVSSSSVTVIGVDVTGEFIALRSSDHRAEAVVLAGLVAGDNVESGPAGSPHIDDGINGQPSLGARAGLGARYWFTPHLALGAQLLESYLSAPAGKVPNNAIPNGTTLASANLRDSALNTVGAITFTVGL